MAGNANNNRKVPPSLEVAHALYGSAFNASSREEVGGAMDDWSELSEEERSFALGHLLYLNLQVQAENGRLLRRAVGELEEINDVVQELADDHFDEEDDGGGDDPGEEADDEDDEGVEEELNEEPVEGEGNTFVENDSTAEPTPGGEGEAVTALEPAPVSGVEQPRALESEADSAAGAGGNEGEGTASRKRSRAKGAGRMPRAARGAQSAPLPPEQTNGATDNTNQHAAGRNA